MASTARKAALAATVVEAATVVWLCSDAVSYVIGHAIVVDGGQSLDATLDTTYVLPGLLRDLVQSNHEQRRLQQETIDSQRKVIQELSTPVIPISDSILIMPLIGTIDSVRAQQIKVAMLEAISRHRARCMIIGIT